MASRKYHTVNVDGQRLLVTRTVKQGAPNKPDELKHRRYNFTLTEQEHETIKAKAREMDMSSSAFVGLVCTLFELQEYTHD